MAVIDFWYEFASTYSYLAAMRIDAKAGSAGVGVRWRPFLLGPIFAAQGMSTSPFNIYPDKGKNMWRDLERQCAALNLPFRVPEPFPQNGLTAARIALLGANEDWGAAFSKAVFAAEFGEGRQVADKSVLADILAKVGRDPVATLAEADDPDIKARLKAQTDEAQRIGVFGAPAFVTNDGELFWGNDRLEQALHWAQHQTLAGSCLEFLAGVRQPGA